MRDLIALNHRLYMYIGRNIGGNLVQSTDGGETWESVHFNTHEHTPKLDTDFYATIKLTIADNVLYAIAIRENKPSIFRISAADDKLIPIHGVPAFEAEPVPDNDRASSIFLHLLRKKRTRIGVFAVSDGTFYAEYKQRLFKWKPGTSKWTATGLVNIDSESTDAYYDQFALAVLGKTVYVSKNLYAGHGKLFQSVDSGDTWEDITSTLPIHFAHFKEITFAGSTVCIATDKGVLISKTGEHWQVITDKNRMPTVIDKFAVDGTAIYGVGDSGAYRLDTHSEWELLSAGLPDSIIRSLVISNDRLYVGTYNHGMFHISLKKQMDIANSF